MNVTVKQPELQSDLHLNIVEPKAELFLPWLNSLRRWLAGSPLSPFPSSPFPSSPFPSSPVPSSPAPRSLNSRTHNRINAEGIEIIKHFEGFPADAEPNVAEAEQAVRHLVAVPLTPNQFSALVSFTYHLGVATFGQSALLKHLNAGRYRAAAKEFELWAYVGARRFPKLLARRVAERKLFLNPSH